MAPILHCVRHAQGFHNLGSEFHSLPDPKLTPLGEEQCAIFKTKRFPDQSKISLVTASPMTRTLHTAALTFEPALKNGKCKSSILALPDAQETSDYPCDTGSEVKVLKEKCDSHQWDVDLHLLKEDWNVKTLGNKYSPASDAVKARARDVRKQIRQLARELVAAGDQDAEIVLCTHGGFLHFFTNDWEESDKFCGTGWANTETRAYTFDLGVDSDDGDAFLVETTNSRDYRGKNYPMYGPEMQERLFRQSMEGWEGQGLPNPVKIGLTVDEINMEVQETAIHIDEAAGTVKVGA